MIVYNGDNLITIDNKNINGNLINIGTIVRIKDNIEEFWVKIIIIDNLKEKFIGIICDNLSGTQEYNINNYIKFYSHNIIKIMDPKKQIEQFTNKYLF